MRSRLGFACRIAAIAIAVMGLVDPAFTWAARTNATVAIVVDAPGGATDPVNVLASQVGDALAATFTVVRGPYGGADAVVIVGRDAPVEAPGATPAGPPVPSFIVAPDASIPRVDIEDVSAPDVISIDGRATIAVRLHAVGAGGRTDRIVLRSGALVVDRQSQTWKTADERATIALNFVPVVSGVAALRVSVEPDGGTNSIANADTAIDVETHRWRVLVHEARPSWASTFVRRAIEDDRRFALEARTTTSRGDSVETGQSVPPLSDAARLDNYDAIVVGAPDALSAADVTALERFARLRGGTVVLLPDRGELGEAARLVRAPRWTTRSGSASIVIDGGTAAAGRWLASEFALPVSLPPGSETIASGKFPAGDAPVVWQSPLGEGRVIVSGALDAWRYRADPKTIFAAFWQAVTARAASLALPPLDVRLSTAVVRPGEAIEARATRRQLPSGATVSMDAWIERTDGTRLGGARAWPDAGAGTFLVRALAPDTSGAYLLVVSDDGAGSPTLATRDEHAFVVATGVARPTPERAALASAWAGAHHGARIAAADARGLAPAIGAAIARVPVSSRAYPMRSPWWIAPFALALGCEWWLRRRAGYP